MTPAAITATAGGILGTLLTLAFTEAVLKPWLRRKTQQHAPAWLAMACAHLDEAFPALIRGQASAADLEAALRSWMEQQTGEPWRPTQHQQTMATWRPDLFLEHRSHD